MERGETLPRPKGAVRKRRLGLEAREMSTLSRPEATESTGAAVGDKVPDTGGDDPVVRDATKETRAQVPAAMARGIRPGYMFREANWQIGRVESKEANGVRTYQKGDRFLAWRKKTRRLKLAAEKRTLRGQGKKRTGGR
ncbi:MAG: hypothetical protein LQ352_007032 [Teloschistes flavicans]|nr:MAG: hypothetical protein LQ352_007032 [Teloschistes flavicans]